MILTPQAAAQARPSQIQAVIDGLKILKAEAAESQAKAVAFRPSRARTSLYTIKK
jgi:hypothetical protein